MAALTENVDRTMENFSCPDLHEPVVADGSTIYQGALVALNAAGEALPAADADTLSHAIGIAQEARTGDAAKSVRVRVFGNIDVPLAYATVDGTNVGENVGVVDDTTVGPLTASVNKRAAGLLVRVEGSVAWVKVGRFGAPGN